MGSVLASKELGSAIPHLWPVLSDAVGNKSGVDCVAKDDFEATEILKE